MPSTMISLRLDNWDNPTVLTEGIRLYVRIARGVYHEVDRRGRRKGILCSGFEPRPRWRLAQRCVYNERHSLWCERCGCYDAQYAELGVRSYCTQPS